MPQDGYASNYNRQQVMVAQGIRRASDLIRQTLGPSGRMVAFRDETGQLIEADRAGVIATMYRPLNPQDKLGASYVADLVSRVHKDAGDGTAIAVVLAQAMLDGAITALRAGVHPESLRRGIEAAVERVCGELAKLAKEVETRKQLASIASTSAGDAMVGEVIAEAMDYVGLDGVISVEQGFNFGLELEVTGEVAVIRVGAETEAAISARKERIESALRVAQIAVQDGYLPGGGVALYETARSLASITNTGGVADGLQIVIQALKAPMAQILANAEIYRQPAEGMGIDVRDASEADMLASGILDTCGVLRIALQHAALTVDRFLMIA